MLVPTVEWVCSIVLSSLLALSPALSAQQPGPAPELKIIVLEGDGAINNIREHTAKDPVIRVENDDGQAITGASVTFTLPGFGAGGFFPGGLTTLSTVTDRDGLAAGRGLRPNNIAGQFQIRVTASYRGKSVIAQIKQTNVAPVAARSSRNRKIAIFGIAAAGAVAGALFAARGGGGGNAPATAGPTGATITPGSPVFGPPR